MIGYSRARLLAQAIGRKLFPIVLYSSPEVIVCSLGGVGTTFVMRHIRQFSDTNDPFDVDGLKHLPRPPRFLARRPKVVFVSGDARDSMNSIERRGWIPIQAAKLGCHEAVLDPQGARARRAYLTAIADQERRWRRYRGAFFSQ